MKTYDWQEMMDNLELAIFELKRSLRHSGQPIGYGAGVSGEFVWQLECELDRYYDRLHKLQAAASQLEETTHETEKELPY